MKLIKLCRSPTVQKLTRRTTYMMSSQNRQHTTKFDVQSSIIAAADKSRKLIGTHSGNFHCDEALACAMLSLLPEDYPHESTTVIRSRDTSVLEQCDILVDVGGEYNAEKRRFDHHQKAFDDLNNNTFPGFKTKLSSAGLIYKHFGRQILENLWRANLTVNTLNLSDQETAKWLNVLHEMIYKNLIEHVDAIDNGIEVSDGPLKYKISTTLSSRVGRLNTKWNSPKEQQTSDYENSQFQKAMEITGQEFIDVVNGYLEQWLPARSIVLDAVNNRFNVDPSGQIICFNQYAPWKEHLFDIERELGIENQIQVALFSDALGNWRIQSVPIEGSDFQNRCPLPVAWRGLRDDELSEKSGIPGCVFAHMSGFIGGAKSYDSVLAMGKESIKQTKLNI